MALQIKFDCILIHKFVFLYKKSPFYKGAIFVNSE